jgi:hypothetical protein
MKKIGCAALLSLQFFISGCIEKSDSTIPAWVTENTDGEWHVGESGKFDRRKFNSNSYVYMGVQSQEKHVFLFAWCDERRKFHSELHLFNASISTNPTFLKDARSWAHASDANVYLGKNSATTFLLIRSLDDISIFNLIDTEQQYLKAKYSFLKIKFSDQSSLAISFDKAYNLLGESCSPQRP